MRYLHSKPALLCAISCLILVWGVLPAYAAGGLTIYGTVVNYQTNQITVTGQGFRPAGPAPTVSFDGKRLVLGSFSNKSIEAALPSGLPPGTYLLVVTNSNGLTATADVTLGADGPPGPASPNPMAIALLRWYDANQTTTFALGGAPWGVAFDGANIWVTAQGSNTVTKMRACDGAVLGTYAVSDHPMDIVFDGANVWVTSLGSPGIVTKFRASDGEVVGTYAVGVDPYGIAFDGVNIWVANSGVSHGGGGNTVTKLRASDGATLGTFTVGTFACAIAFDGANVWVTNHYANTISKLAGDGTPLGTFPAGSYPRTPVFDGTNIWVTNSPPQGNGGLTKIRASDGSIVGTFPLPTSSNGAAFDGANLWVASYPGNTVTKLRTIDGAILGTYPVAGAVEVAFDGANIWVTSNIASGVVSKL